MANRRFCAGLGALALGACAAQPAPAPKLPAIAAAFDAVPGWTPAAPADAADRGHWWRRFDDSTLDDLETRGADASPTLAAALARRDAALAAVRQSAASQLPEIDAQASAQRARQSRNRPLAATRTSTFDDYRVGLVASYEIDLWGHVRRQVAAARAEAAASEADLASARLVLQAQIADAYVRLRGLDAESELLARTGEAYARAADLTRRRHSGGAASGLDENRALTVLGNARALAVDVANQRTQVEHELAALIGAPASGFHIAPQPRVPAAPAVPVGTPAALLQRRPDIAAAERRVAEANAEIGVAHAALFPTITLGAGGGFETTGHALLAAPSTFWALGPLGLNLPVFDAGRRRAAERQARAGFAAAAAAYRSSVIGAMREAEDALAAVRDLAREAEEQRAAVKAAEATSALSFTRYREGASDYLEVVTAQTDALNAERALLAVETRHAQASVAIVRALGGPAE